MNKGIFISVNVVLVIFFLLIAIGSTLVNPDLKRDKIVMIEEEFTPELDNDGKLKWRPYWLVGDKWDDREESGMIKKTDECRVLVIAVWNNGHDPEVQQDLIQLWMEGCVGNL